MAWRPSARFLVRSTTWNCTTDGLSMAVTYVRCQHTQPLYLSSISQPLCLSASASLQCLSVSLSLCISPVSLSLRISPVSPLRLLILASGLGFRPSKIVLVGESAGGNILTALVLRLTQQQLESPYPIRQPDALVLGYPVSTLICLPGQLPGLPQLTSAGLLQTLNLALSPSPSRTLHMCDPFLAFGISVACVSSYVPQTRDATSNILLSPIFANSGM